MMSWMDDEERNEPVCVGHVRVVRTTAKALLVEVESGEEVWIPRSEICDEGSVESDAKTDDEGDLYLPRWLAEAKELDEQ